MATKSLDEIMSGGWEEVPQQGKSMDEIMSSGYGQQPPTETVPPPNQSFTQLGSGALSAIGSAGIGALKGVGSTLLGISELGQKTLGKGIVEPIYKGITGQDMGLDESIAQGQAIREKYLTPKGTAQSVGFGAEQLGEFIVPGGVAVKGAKAATQIATKAPTGLKTVTRLGGRAATEATSAAGVTAAQTGGDVEEMKKNAAFGAAVPVVGSALGVTSRAIKGRFDPAGIINSLIKPLSKDFSYGKNPGRAVADEGIIAKDLEELAQKISERRSVAGQKIQAILSHPENQMKRIDLSDVLAPIDEAIVRARRSPKTNAALISRLEDTKKDLMGVVTDISGNEKITRSLTDLSPSQATELKRDIGDITKFTGNASDDKAVNMALKKVYGSTKERINKAVPEVAPLNERYADLTSAEIATKYRDIVEQRHNLVSLGVKMGGYGGAITSAVMTGNIPIALTIGVGGAALEKAMGSVQVKTRVAAWLGSASSKEKQALFNKIPGFKSSIERVFGPGAATGEKKVRTVIGSAKPPSQASAGAFVGFQPEVNKDGKVVGYKFDPTAAVAGVIAGRLSGSALAKMNPKKAQIQETMTRLQAQKLKLLAQGLKENSAPVKNIIKTMNDLQKM